MKIKFSLFLPHIHLAKPSGIFTDNQGRKYRIPRQNLGEFYDKTLWKKTN